MTLSSMSFRVTAGVTAQSLAAPSELNATASSNGKSPAQNPTPPTSNSTITKPIRSKPKTSPQPSQTSSKRSKPSSPRNPKPSRKSIPRAAPKSNFHLQG